MKIFTVIQGFLLTFGGFFLAPFIVPFAIPFINWDDNETVGPTRTNPPTPTIMGNFPWWLSWFGTPDQRLPCDTGISECKSQLDKYGKWIMSWIWVGTRNQFMGLACWLGSRTSDYIPEDVEGMWERTDEFGTVWIYRKTIGKYRFYTGYTVYALLDGTFRTAPIFTVKK